MGSITAIIVDDELLGRRRILDLLKNVEEIDVLKECNSGRSAIAEINQHQPDIVFLDINMHDMDGFEVLQNLNFAPKPKIVFVTAHDKFAKDAFDYEAFDFLLKPFEDERFYRTVNNVMKTSKNNDQEIFKAKLNRLIELKREEQKEQDFHSLLPVRQGNKTILVEIFKVRYILASGYYAEVFTKVKKHVIRESLANLMESLDENIFFRISRSSIINLNFVQEIIHSNYSEIDVKMKDGKVLRVSKTHKKDLLEKLGC